MADYINLTTSKGEPILDSLGNNIVIRSVTIPKGNPFTQGFTTGKFKDAAVFLKAGNCRFSSLGTNVTYGGEVYVPGLLLVEDVETGNPTGLTITPDRCNELTNEPIGTFVYLGFMRKGTSSSWALGSTHIYVLGGIENIGRQQFQLLLETPEAALFKSEVEMWSHEYASRKYNSDWFKNLSDAENNIVNIEMD